MSEFAPMLTGWSAGAAGALLAAVWEGALLAGLVWLVLRLLPGLSAAARSVVWLNVFILMALLHLVPLFTGSSRGHSGARGPRRAPRPPLEPGRRRRLAGAVAAARWPASRAARCTSAASPARPTRSRPDPRLPSYSITTAAPSSSAPARTSPGPASSDSSTPASFFRPASPRGSLPPSCNRSSSMKWSTSAAATTGPTSSRNSPSCSSR